MAATNLAFSFPHYDVRIKDNDLIFCKEEFEYAYFMMIKKRGCNIFISGALNFNF